MLKFYCFLSCILMIISCINFRIVSSWWIDPFIIYISVNSLPYLPHVCYGKRIRQLWKVHRKQKIKCLITEVVKNNFNEFSELSVLSILVSNYTHKWGLPMFIRLLDIIYCCEILNKLAVYYPPQLPVRWVSLTDLGMRNKAHGVQGFASETKDRFPSPLGWPLCTGHFILT